MSFFKVTTLWDPKPVQVLLVLEVSRFRRLWWFAWALRGLGLDGGLRFRVSWFGRFEALRFMDSLSRG